MNNLLKGTNTCYMYSQIKTGSVLHFFLLTCLALNIELNDFLNFLFLDKAKSFVHALSPQKNVKQKIIQKSESGKSIRISFFPQI